MIRALAVLVTLAVLSFPAAATIVTYTAAVNGTSVPDASPGTGFTTVTVDDVAHTLAVGVTFSGLLGPTTASHIHCCTVVAGTGTAGVATQTPSFSGFPLGVTSGTYSNTFDMTLVSTFNPAFVTAHGGTVVGAESALLAGLAAGEAYLNIHTTVFPGGEIRGFLEPVPEADTYALLIVGIGVVAWAARGRRIRTG